MRDWRRSAKTALALARAGNWRRIVTRTAEIAGGRAAPLPENLAPAPRPAGIWRVGGEKGRRLLMVGRTYGRDGAPLSQFELASGLAGRGWRITAVAAEDGPLRARYQTAGIDAEVWPELRAETAALSFYDRDVEKLARRIAAAAPALVYANTVDSHTAIDAARMLGVPSVWNIRESESWRLRLADRCPEVAARALACFSYPQAVICVAGATAAAWRAFAPADRLHVIYNAPAHVTDSVGRTDVKVRRDIVSIGRICKRKGQRDILDAFLRLPAKLRRDWRLIFVGGKSEQYAVDLISAASRRSDAQIEFLGEIGEDEVASVLSGAALLVHAAHAEAFPRVLIEAAASGVPIVATRAGGAAERLRDGESALFCDAGNVGCLAQSMARALDDADLRRRLAERARRALIDDWTYEDMLGAYEAQLDSAMQESAR